jgi:hypothetical protein
MIRYLSKTQGKDRRKSSQGIPLGMYLSVEKQPPPIFASHRDAPLRIERGIPTGCHSFLAFFSTERCIPYGMPLQRIC